ncbi:hypothetical protein DRN67_03500 [Candidatus Micrarchaeota archaeon]|nr:MAG: hypothetical protein DRN67_03500 [Candidatus Micrarchaeota archaeon]
MARKKEGKDIGETKGGGTNIWKWLFIGGVILAIAAAAWLFLTFGFFGVLLLLIPSEEQLVENALDVTVIIENDYAAGSGVIIGSDDEESWILTNRHVVDPDLDGSGAPNQVVTLRSGRTYFPTQILIPPYENVDLAYVAIPAKNVKYAGIDYNYEPVQRERVIAVGAPLGLESTVTEGIVSAIRYETLPGGYEAEIIQTDAAINPGNSGGGLFSLENGNLLGINTFKYAGTEGLGFAYSIKLYDDLPKKNWRELTNEMKEECRIYWDDGEIEKVPFEDCSLYGPYWCNPATSEVEERADICGCPPGYQVYGTTCI